VDISYYTWCSDGQRLDLLSSGYFFPDTGLATWIQPNISCGLLLLVLVKDLSDIRSTERRSR
jgi:hypothetical protein